MITLLQTLATCAFLAAVAVNAAQPATCVPVKFTLHAYSGPVVIDSACLGANGYNGTLTVEAIDLADGIFRNGFDPEDWP